MKVRTLLTPLTLAALASLGGLAAAAQSSAPTTDEAPPSEAAENTPPEGATATGTQASFFAVTTVTATGSEKDAFETSTPVSVIAIEQIERRQAQNATELLRDLPGVDVNGVGTSQVRPVIRGQRGLRVLFLENGLRLNNPRRQTDFGEITALVDVDNIEQIEVVRGPASVLYGTDAIGGVLNLITKLPPYGDGSWVGGDARLGYGSAGDLTGGHAAVSGHQGRWSFQLGYGKRQSDPYQAAAGSFGDITLDDEVTVVDTGVDDESLFGTLGFDLSPRHRLGLRASRYRADESGFGFVEPELLGDSEDFRIRILYPFQDFDRISLSYLGSVLESPVADSLDVQLYSQNNERQLVNDIDINIGPIFPGAPNSSVEADTLNFTDLESVGLRAEAVKLAGGDHLVTWGVEAFRDDSRNTDHSTTTTSIRFPFPPFEIVDVSNDDIANAPNARNESASLFVQDEIALSAKLSLSLGARFQKISTRALATPDWDIRGLDFDDQAFVYSLSAIYAIDDTLKAVGSWGTAFRAPNIVERLFNGITPEGIGFQILNSDLESEESENFDLGLKYRRRNAVFELTYFHNEIDKGIIQAFLSPAEIAQLPQDVQDQIEAAQLAFVVQQRNIDRLVFDGFEVVVGYRAENGIGVGTNYTNIDGKRVDSTNPPTGDSVGDKLNLYVRWDPPSERYWLEYRLRNNGSQPASLDPDEPLPPVGAILPSFTVHQLSGGVTLFERDRQKHSINLLIDNLTDELYAEFSNATFFRPQPGRNVSVSYRVSF